MNHTKKITEQKYQIDRLNLESLEFQTSRKLYEEKITELDGKLKRANVYKATFFSENQRLKKQIDNLTCKQSQKVTKD